MKSVKRKRPSWFTRAAHLAARAAGRPATFAIAVAVIALWAWTGPIFDYGDTWPLVFNTSTTIITFLMVFLVQNAQNRDTEALQIKTVYLPHHPLASGGRQSGFWHILQPRAQAGVQS